MVDESRPIRVVVADNYAVRAGIRVALGTESDIAVVGEADDGNVALRLAHELRPDVLVLDLALPGLAGLDVIRALRPVLPDLRIVVFSLETQLGSLAIAAGAAAFVSKDGRERELAGEIRRVARRAPAPTPSDGVPRLGEYLLAHGLITVAQLEAALAWQRELAERGRSPKLGELLRELGTISADDLDGALKREAQGLL